MAISKQLTNRLVRLERLQYQQQLSDLKQGLAALEKQKTLAEVLDGLITETDLSPLRNSGPQGVHPPLPGGLQLGNGSAFRTRLAASLQQCLDAHRQQIASIKSMAATIQIRHHRLQRLQNLINQ